MKKRAPKRERGSPEGRVRSGGQTRKRIDLFNPSFSARILPAKILFPNLLRDIFLKMFRPK
jgi:hypothetical protein